MAEAVGLAFGALALLGMFKDCIDLFSTISAAKSLGSDYELLNTKLDIEKLLLLQWVDRVRLVDDRDYDRRLDEPRINKGVSSILAAIRLLLSESSQLQTRYGMKRVEVATTVDRTISEPRMHQFMRDFEKMSLRIRATQKDASLKQRFCWIVRDREKFSILIQELSGLINSLTTIIPAVQDQFVFMTKADLEKIGSFRQVHLVLEAAREHEQNVADLAEADIAKRCQDRILRHLCYRGVDDRRNNIADPHYDTLQWALHPPNSDVQWDDLGCWLRSGSGTYWISGKAGSGKSTLMKWLYMNKCTERMLETWLPSLRLVVANFFIWGLGSPEQKTQEGLCRGLLYSILHAEPSLIPQVLPEMWRDAYNVDTIDLEPPSAPEIRGALSKLKSETMEHKFCFFIDGLDEYAGDLIHGIAFINNLVSSDGIKIVVSSRPIPICVQAFCGSPKLQLQDLTKDDIRAYVDDTIGSHPHIQDLMTMGPQAVRKILRDLVDKASGVFLWVILACRSLLEGFAAFDYPDELQRRVDELPPELESLFQHMLDKVEPRYQVQAARLLKMCYLRRLHGGDLQDIRAEPLVWESTFTLGLALVEECGLDMRHNIKFHHLSLEDRRTKCKILEARLRSRCCGLLEVQRRRMTSEVTCCFCDYSRHNDMQHDNLVDSTVEFMHRSVFEFLSNPDIWKLQCLQTSGIGFDAYGVLSQMDLLLAYASSRRQETVDFTGEALLLAKYTDDHSSESTAWALDSLLRMIFGLSITLPNLSSFPKESSFFAKINSLACQPPFAELQLNLILAVELGMLNVVKQRLAFGMMSPSQKALLLRHAISRPCVNCFSATTHLDAAFLLSQMDVSPDMVSFLLSIGCDPNIKVTSFSNILNTPWESWLEYLENYDRLPHSVSIIADVTELLINAGADINVQGPVLGRSIETLIDDCLTSLMLDTDPLSMDSSPAGWEDPLLDPNYELPWSTLEIEKFDAMPLEFVPTFPGGERAMRGRCNEILQLLARKRSLVNTQVKDEPPGRDRPPSRGAALQLSDPGTTFNATKPQKQRKRPLFSESQLSGETAHSDGPSRAVKRRRRGR